MQFPNHGLLCGLAPVNAALWKLPGVRTDTLTPEHLIFLVEQDDADVGPKAVPVKHNQTPIFKLRQLCTASAVYQRAQPPLISRISPMKASQFFISTLKEAPADAEVV